MTRRIVVIGLPREEQSRQGQDLGVIRWGDQNISTGCTDGRYLVFPCKVRKVRVKR